MSATIERLANRRPPGAASQFAAGAAAGAKRRLDAVSDFASYSLAVSPSGWARVKRLLPCETRSIELNSAGSFLLAGIFFILQSAHLAPADPQLSLHFLANTIYPSWGVGVTVLSLSVLHFSGIVFSPATRGLRTACVFISFMLWTSAAASSCGMGEYPPGGAPAMLYIVMSASLGWAFLMRVTDTNRRWRL
jgi:hypothetical protein